MSNLVFTNRHEGLTSYSTSPIISSSTFSSRDSQFSSSGSSWSHIVLTLHAVRAFSNAGTEASRSVFPSNSCVFACRLFISASPLSTGNGGDRYSDPDARTALFTGGPVIVCAWTYMAPALSPASVIFSCYIVSTSVIYALSQYGNSHRITTKSTNVFPHPLNRQSLVLNIKIFFFSISEFEYVQTIVDRYDNNWLSSFDRVGDYSSSVYTARELMSKFKKRKKL